MIKEVDSNFKFGNVDLSYILDFSDKNNRNFVLLTQNGKSFLGGFVTDKDYNMKKLYVMPYVKNLKGKYFAEMHNYANEKKARNESLLDVLRASHKGVS